MDDFYDKLREWMTTEIYCGYYNPSDEIDTHYMTSNRVKYEDILGDDKYLNPL